MTIRIKKDRIEFTANGGSTFTLAESNTGFTFDGTIQAGQIFQDGFQGTVAGFTAGGWLNPGSSNTIDKFPFATDTNATDYGDLFRPRHNATGQSSTISGYVSGGVIPPQPTVTNTIDKFPFAASSGSSFVGNLSQTRYATSGQSLS